MTSVCVAVSGRADGSPLKPVIIQLKAAGIEVSTCDLDRGSESSHRLLLAAYAADRAIDTHRPDWFLVLGDRYETLSACLTATVRGVKIAHIHGGEVTLGSFDNSLRNAISMMADVHFVSAIENKAKLVGMGVNEGLVHVVGAPGLDNMDNLPPRKPERLFVVTYHPATRATEDVRELLMALDAFPKYRVVFTGVNADPGSDEIRRWISNCRQGEIRESMASTEYLSLLRRSACLIGNSSSGLIEAPAIGVSSVNIGDRQKGRLKGKGVFDCPCEHHAIVEAINQAIAYRGPWESPYGEAGASRCIAEIMAAA